MSKMLDEIRQQPEALERTLRAELPRIERFKLALAKSRPRLIVLVARGTSDNAAQFARYLLEITTGIPVSLCAPSVHTLYRAQVDLSDALVIAISQSGESTDTNVVLQDARERGAMTVGITNEPKSSLTKLAERVFLVRAGKERSVAATKTYTGQIMLLYLIAYALGADLRIEDLQRIPAYAAEALKLEEEMAALAGRYRFMSHAVVVGRGLNYSNAFEFALKLMETCYVVAERFSSADFLHGPIALVEANFPMFVFAPSGVTWPGMKDTIAKLQLLRAETVVITDEANRSVVASRVIRIPAKLPEILTPIPYIVPAQLLAACLATEKGLDPDKPRTLNKITRTM
jgi:glucosamine--fructose-6-phosphate aminotransferase (isomerizing)